jgi:hypothetical protein
LYNVYFIWERWAGVRLTFLFISVAEPHNFYAAPDPAPGKNFDAAPAAPAPAPTLLYSKKKILKRAKSLNTF